ncbi:MAG: riboflavin synthase [Mariprofundaceae bacterium]
MFTGIITDIGEIVMISPTDNHAEFIFKNKLDMSGWSLGDSIAVDGCCLTITRFESKHAFAAMLSAETLNLTCFNAYRPGVQVNLEPALRAGEPLGGHLVSGHIDGCGAVVKAALIDGHCEMSIKLSEHLSRYVVKKGSVTVNGVSLTINSVQQEVFTVNLIPYTLQHTNLGNLTVGDQANIETDMIGRYVERLLQPSMKLEKENT